MTLLPEAHLHARRHAPYHVQVEIVDRPARVDTTSKVRIGCRVVRVFRSDGALGVGGFVSFELPVYTERQGPPTGPFYMPYRTFAAASHLEVYLTGTPPDCKIACEEFCVIPDRTETPALSLEELERFDARHRTRNTRS